MKAEEIYYFLNSYLEKDTPNSNIDWLKVASNDLSELIKIKVNRVEIINHNSSQFENGRLFVFRGEIETQLQDDGETLKIFI